jgi:hypothetical protein
VTVTPATSSGAFTANAVTNSVTSTTITVKDTRGGSAALTVQIVPAC